MLLIILGFLLILFALRSLRSRAKLLDRLKRASGTLQGYTKNEATGKFHAILSFFHNSDKHFFKNVNPFEYPEHAVNSSHPVYYETPKLPEVFGTPIKVTMRHGDTVTYTPHICVGLGLLCILLFTELTGFTILFGLFLGGLYFYFTRPSSALEVHKIIDEDDKRYLVDFPVADTFPEDKFKSMKILTFIELARARAEWCSRLKVKGLVLLAVSAVLFMLVDFTAMNQKAEGAGPTPLKMLSIEEVLDAGGVDAAGDKFADAKDFVRKYCVAFQSSSCLFSYEVMDDANTAKLNERVINFLLLDLALIALAFAMICIFSNSIFLKYDTVPPSKDDVPKGTATVPKGPVVATKPATAVKVPLAVAESTPGIALAAPVETAPAESPAKTEESDEPIKTIKIKP